MNAIELCVPLQFRISFLPSGSFEGRFCNKITRLCEDSALILSAPGPPAPSKFPNPGEDIDIISFRSEVPVILSFPGPALIIVLTVVSIFFTRIVSAPARPWISYVNSTSLMPLCHKDLVYGCNL
jgi:hypothetical protein